MQYNFGYTVLQPGRFPKFRHFHRLHPRHDEQAGEGIEGLAAFADAPVARTAQAAIDGTLSIMVGGSGETFERIRPLLDCMAANVTRDLMERTRDAGFAQNYYTAVIETLGRR